MDGKKVWSKDFGRLDSGYYMVPAAQWGFASSPIIVGDKVIVECDVQKDSFLTCLSLPDGKEIWRTARDDVPTWSTPAYVESQGRRQIVCNGCRRMAGYDFETGKELWWLQGGGDIPVPTPIHADGLIYIANAHGYAAPIFAIRADASGEITLKPGEVSGPSIPWAELKNGAYMQTPLVYRGQLYTCRDNGVLNVFDPATGKSIYRQRLGSGRTGFTASPVAADGKVYFTSEEGDVLVVAAGPEYKLLATNPLGETFMSTPAISEGILYFRTRGNLVAIGAGNPAK
jgi:outer membrane protein assembly factor BamB